jgi:predicted small metal-binding protein
LREDLLGAVPRRGAQNKEERGMKKIECSELGIEDCDFVAKGETAGDVVKEAVEHLRAEHDVDMPDADVILAGKVSQDPLEMVDPAVALVVQRLTDALNIVPAEGAETPKPSIGRTSSR